MRYTPKVKLLFVVALICSPFDAWAVCPDEHMLYSKGDVLVRDRAKIQGGSVRAEATVEVGFDAQVHGDVLGQNAILKDRAVVQGNMTTSASLTQSSSAVVSGTIAQNTALPLCILSEKPAISFGSVDKTVPWDSQATVPPGSYRDLLVRSRGTVRFTPGVYNFRKVILEPDAKIRVQTGGNLDINVEEQLFLDGRIVMALEGLGVFPNVRIYSNQTTVLQVGHDSRLFGSLVAPKAEVRFFERTAMQGRILADRITVETDAVVSASLDRDGDGVPDVVEGMMGSDPENASDKPNIAVPTRWFVAEHRESFLSYNYSGFPTYSDRNKVAVEFPAGSLSSTLVPIVQIKETSDPSIPTIPIPSTWAVTGKVFQITGGIQRNQKVLFGFPLTNSSPSNTKPHTLLLLHHTGSAWSSIPVEKVVGKTAYAFVPSFSPFVLLQNVSASPVIYVNSDRGSVGDGQSWATAYQRLEHALQDAAVSKKEIWMAGQHPTVNRAVLAYFLISATDPDAAFTVPEGVRIYGGFWGHFGTTRQPDTLRSQRDLNFRPYISHKYYKPDSVIWELGKYAKHVFKLEKDVVLDGLDVGSIASTFPTQGLGAIIENTNVTIVNCRFANLRTTSGNGAAIRVTGSSGHADIQNCQFFHAEANSWNGGAIYVAGGAHLRLSGVSQWDNAASSGAAVYIENSSAYIEESHFYGNRGQAGGAIYVKNSRLDIRDSKIDSNTAYVGDGGGLYIDSLSKIFISNTSLSGNRATGNGGGVALFAKDSAVVASTQFIGNHAAGGGGVYNFKSSPILDKCVFSRNSAGGGGGIYNRTGSSPVIRNSILVDNSAQSDVFGGAGVLNIDSSSPTILNCTIYRNSTEPSGAMGGGVFSFLSSKPLIENTIIWDNRAFEDPEIGGQHGNTSFRNSLVKGFDNLRFRVDTVSLPPIDLGGNLGQDTAAHDPRFRNAGLPAGLDASYLTSDDGLVLQSGSVAVNAGSPTNAPATDILGTPRPIGSGVDIGAYEADTRVPVVIITSPSKTRDTVVNRSPIKVFYTLDGEPESKDIALSEGLNKIIIDTTYTNGNRGADSVNAVLDTQGPTILITHPGRDTLVDTSMVTVLYTIDGVPGSKMATLQTGYNRVTVEASDSLGNVTIATRVIAFFPAGSSIVATVSAPDTVFTYQLLALDGRGSTGPAGVTLTHSWRQIQGAPVYINAGSSKVAGFVSRGDEQIKFELQVSDDAGVFPAALDTVTIEVLEPENPLEFAQALEVAKTNQDGAFTLTIDPTGVASRYTQESSIRLEGSLTGTTGALGVIRWTCNTRTGTFQPTGQSWESPALTLDPGDNWITLVYTQGNQIAADRILVSSGEVDMAGFDLNPGILWADSAMQFKLVVNVDDPAVTGVHLVRIADQEMDLGELVDDGTGGDDFALDRRYTLEFNLTPHADSVYWFRVRANKSGVNSYSALYTFHPQQKYNPVAFQSILDVHAGASALFNALRITGNEKAAMDSVANWLIEQPSVAVAGIGPGEKAICWQYTNGIHAMISNAPEGTRGGGKVKTKALSPYQFDGAFGPFDDGLTAYRGAIIPAANADTSLYDADSLILNSSIPDSLVTVEHWKNWGGYKAVVVATHGNTFGYDSLSQIRWQPTTDGAQGQSFWAKPYVTVVNHTKADTISGSKYWQDLTSGGKTFPRMIVVDIGYGIEYALTSKFFKTYNPNLKGALLSFGSCRSLYNDELWNAIRANGDATTAMIGYSDYVKGNFAGKAAEIIFKSLVQGKTLKQSVDSVVSYCGQTGNGFCTVKNGKAWDSTTSANQGGAFLEYRGDSSYTLIPRKGRVWAWGSGSGQGLYSCASTNADTVPNIRNLSSISGGLGHGLALEVNGTVWGWGWNGAGQLGIAPSGGVGSVPTTNYRSCTPLQIFPGIGYRGISAGASRSLAVDSLGRVWRAGEFTGASSIGWTHDAFGNTWAAGVVGVSPQLDTVAGLSNVVAVSAGSLHNLALRGNGEVWAWGGNVSGELGMGDTLPRITPIQIPTLSNIVSISAGQNPALGHYGSHSLALDRSGRVWAWGENEFGQLGLGDTLDCDTPKVISGLSRIRSISAGVGGSSAVDSTGGLWVWGWNDRGQLALGHTINQTAPVQVPALSNVVSVSHGVFPVILDNTGNARWSCGTACGNAFVNKKPGSFEVGSGGDEFGMSLAP